MPFLALLFCKASTLSLPPLPDNFLWLLDKRDNECVHVCLCVRVQHNFAIDSLLLHILSEMILIVRVLLRFDRKRFCGVFLAFSTSLPSEIYTVTSMFDLPQ